MQCKQKAYMEKTYITLQIHKKKNKTKQNSKKVMKTIKYEKHKT